MSVPTSKHWRMEVEWVDSTLTHQEGWVTITSALARRKRRDAVRCLSVGFVLADDDAGIVLAATVHGNEVAGITHIPTGAIVGRKRLRPGEDA